MLRATLKSLFARKVRLFLSTLAVVLGVSFVTGTLVLTDTLNRTFDELFAGINENVDVAVRAVNSVDASNDLDRDSVPASLIPVLKEVDGVAEAVGEVSGQAVLVDPRTEHIDPNTGQPDPNIGEAYDTGGAPSFGSNWTGDTATTAAELVKPGSAPHRQQVVVDKATADKLGLKIGDKLSVLTRQRERFTVSGIFRIAGKDSVGGATVVSFDTETAQRLLLQPGQYSAISVAADDDVSQEQLRERIIAALRPGAEKIATAITGEGLASIKAAAADGGVSPDQLRKRVVAALPSEFKEVAAATTEEGLASIKDAAADGGVPPDQLRERIVASLPLYVDQPGGKKLIIEAITGKRLAEEQAGVVQEAISGLSVFLLVFAAISIFVSAFIIFNTFTMLVAQRVRELALLRAVGASRGQVQLSVQAEAAVIGFAGALLGLLLGALLALGLRGLFSATGVKLPAGDLVFLPRTILVAFAVGLLVTGVAAFVPARTAATVPPVAAMRETYVLPTRSLRTRAVGGAVTTVLGGILMGVGLAGSGSTAAFAVGGGAMAVFLGVATLSPLFSPAVTGVLGRPLPRLFGATGTLGRRNAMRNPRRTASTASALMIGLAVVSAFSVLGESIKVSVRETVSNSLGADFYLSPSSFGLGFSGDVARSLAGKPGVEAVTGVRFGEVVVDEKKVGVSAGEPAALQGVLALDGVDGDITKLADGGLIVDSDTAAERGFTVGKKIPVVFSDGPVELTLVGTYERNELAGQYMVALGEWNRHTVGDLDQFVLVKAKPDGDTAAVRATIDQVTQSFPNIKVRDQTEFIAEQEEQIDMLLGMIYVLLGLAVVIAMFGIVNTLALSVIERTREIGLLRAVGMTRGQLRTLVRLEAVVIAVFGALLGVIVGSCFGWALASALESQGITKVAYPIGTIIVVVIVGAVLGVVAAIFPARRAARMDVLRAIAAA
jgi:putative ABC transport system permease protein